MNTNSHIYCDSKGPLLIVSVSEPDLALHLCELNGVIREFLQKRGYNYRFVIPESLAVTQKEKYQEAI